MNVAQAPKDALPVPAQVPYRNGGTGQGSDSALDAMLRKRREGENRAAEDLPEAPEDEDSGK